MSEGVSVRVNLTQFQDQIRALKLQMQKNAVRAAANAGAQEFVKAVRRAAPRLRKAVPKRPDPGRLRKAIYKYRTRNPPPGEVIFNISFRKGKAEQKVTVKRKGGTAVINRDAFYGKFLEEGYTPRGPGQAVWRLASVGTKGRFAGRVQARRAAERARLRAIRGVVKRPFLLPGFNAARDAATKAFQTKLEERLAAIDKQSTP